MCNVRYRAFRKAVPYNAPFPHRLQAQSAFYAIFLTKRRECMENVPSEDLLEVRLFMHVKPARFSIRRVHLPLPPYLRCVPHTACTPSTLGQRPLLIGRRQGFQVRSPPGTPQPHCSPAAGNGRQRCPSASHWQQGRRLRSASGAQDPEYRSSRPARGWHPARQGRQCADHAASSQR